MNATDNPYALYVAAENEGYYVTCWGFGSWDGNQWTFNGTQFDFCDIYDTWFMRDPQGALQWYAVGNNNFANGIRIWKFNPQSLSFGCKECYVFGDGSAQYLGGALAIWGSASDDVYVTGELADYPQGPYSGRVYHFDGTSWLQITNFGTIPVPCGIGGSAADDVWIPLGFAGTLLHYAPAAAPPPSLGISWAGTTNVSVTWPSSASGFRLQAAPALSPAAIWASLTNVPTLNGNQFQLVVPMTNGNQFFRLISP
jgi:hypothetical protein